MSRTGAFVVGVLLLVIAAMIAALLLDVPAWLAIPGAVVLVVIAIAVVARRAPRI